MKIDRQLVKYRQTICSRYMAKAKGILHLGAHLGMESEEYADQDKPVLWVEAMPDVHAHLTERLKGFPKQRALCGLLGDIDGELTRFNISNNSGGVSSSIFEFGPFGEGVQSLWPKLELKMVSHIDLPMVRLDSLLEERDIDPSDYDFWVVDLQGAELKAIVGGRNALNRCIAILVEVSTAEVYRGGVLWPELSAWLGEKGFVNLWEPARAHDDVLFIRRGCLDETMDTFHSQHYLRHNQRRLEHLASLGLNLFNKNVLEVGAGVGDHTSFYLDRGCEVVTSDARPENVLALKQRYAGNDKVTVKMIDMNCPEPIGRHFQIIHCYGLLYHLSCPREAIKFLCEQSTSLVLLETCVSYGSDSRLNPVEENAGNISQAINGVGCRPSRKWIMEVLAEFMPHVYVTMTQPAHEEFPTDWGRSSGTASKLTRSVFIASHENLDNNPMLLRELPARQSRR